MVVNPSPTPFDPAAIAARFAQAQTHLAAAQSTLDAIPESSESAVEIALDDICFDVSSNAARACGVGIGAILGGTLGTGLGGSTSPLPVIRFDVAAAHLLAGFCDLLRADEPSEPLTRVQAARSAMAALGGWAQIWAALPYPGQGLLFALYLN